MARRSHDARSARALALRRRMLALGGAALLCGRWPRAAAARRADPSSDAPEEAAPFAQPASGAGPTSYADALRSWRRAEDLNAWLGARFEYDGARALQLSETQRQRAGALPIHEPAAFFESPRGVCVDAARFAVETLRAIDPEAHAAYLMIEFDPATQRFAFPTLDGEEAAGKYYQISYTMATADGFFATGANIRQPDGTLQQAIPGECVFWQTAKPAR